MKLRHWRRCLGLALAGLAAYWGYHFRLDHRYDWTVRGAAQRYGVDPALVKAVVWKESRFKPTARGTAGEIGLMQLRELAAVEWSSAENLTGFEMDHLLDPRTNILAGTWYLAHLLRRYRGTDDPVPFALADYNATRISRISWRRSSAWPASRCAAPPTARRSTPR